MTPLSIKSQIQINAMSEKVWEVLINLAVYNDWNSEIQVIEVPESIARGSRAKLCAAPKVEITAMETLYL